MISTKQKIVRTFVFAFLGSFLPALANLLFDISSTANWTVAKAALVAAIIGSVTAAVRATIAVLPILPDDTAGLTKDPKP